MLTSDSGLRDHIVCKGSNLVWLCARQKLSLHAVLSLWSERNILKLTAVFQTIDVSSRKQKGGFTDQQFVPGSATERNDIAESLQTQKAPYDQTHRIDETQ